MKFSYDLFDGAVVDGDRQFISLDWKPDRGTSISLEKVFWGEDLIHVDREACRVAGEMIPQYLEQIDQLRQVTLTQNEESGV